jgi:hypothetical protein
MRGKNSSRWRCRACNKTSFGSIGRAEEAMDRIGPTEGRRIPKRAYPCPYGNGYHLTSQDERTTT